MNVNNLYNGITGIRDAYILEALETKPGKRRQRWVHWAAVAACGCLVLAGIAMFLSRQESASTGTRMWSQNFPAEDYFPGRTQSAGTTTDSMLPESDIFVQTRDFSGQRTQLEQEGVIPAMESHNIFECQADYDAAGAIGFVTISWHNRDSADAYSDLSILVSRQPMEAADDCVSVALDENGNPVERQTTVTQRDGIQILGDENPVGTKTLSFQLDGCWYRITGSWNNSYTSVVALLDWIWEHPIALERFSMDSGDISR